MAKGREDEKVIIFGNNENLKYLYESNICSFDDWAFLHLSTSLSLSHQFSLPKITPDRLEPICHIIVVALIAIKQLIGVQ